MPHIWTTSNAHAKNQAASASSCGGTCMAQTKVCNVLTYVRTYIPTDTRVQDDDTSPAYGWEVKSHCCTFLQNPVWLFQRNLVDIAWGKGHLFWIYVLKWPWPWEMVACLKVKILHFCTSPNLFWIFQRILVGTLPGVRGTFYGNMTSNDLDLGKWQPVWRSKSCIFTHFFDK